MTAAISLDRLSKTYPDGSVVLKPLSLTIEQGELFVLVGPSGCGKSTLLNLIAGLIPPSSGQIRLDGRRIDPLPPQERNMAMVFQSYAIYPHMTVRENLAFPLKIAGRPKAEIRQRVAATAALLQLTPLLARKPRELSGGQRQRVAMGRAMVREPAAFLLDEPLSNLDARLRVEMRGEIARLQKRLRATMIYVTHDQTEAMTLGDRIAVLNQGEIQQLGTPQALYQRPRNLFVAGFIGSPAMNLLPLRKQGGQLLSPWGAFPCPQWLLQRPSVPESLLAGIRPEHFRCPLPADDSGAWIRLRARIERLEWLGTALDLYCSVSGTGDSVFPAATGGSFIARLGPDLAAKPGEEIELEFDSGRLQLFDRDSGINLGYPDDRA